MSLSEVEIKSGATVVTACDSNFVWGAMLLGLSLRYNNINCPYHVLGYDLSDDEITQISSIPNTTVFPVHKSSSRSVCTQKPEAIATADTQIIVWMDADCLVKGNLEPLFICPDNQLQIRWREPNENGTIYRDYYAKDDRWGDIPAQVLKQWKADINDMESPKIKTVCQTNCFVINQSHIEFIDKWKCQMEKVIPVDTTGVYAKKSLAYSMTDESVLNSLFAFYAKAPSTYAYQMDKDSQNTCLHFGLSPKPWQHWTKQSLNHYDYIMKLINRAYNQDIKLPPLPGSFQPKNKTKEVIFAHLRQLYKNVRYYASSKFRQIRKAVS